MERNDEGSGRSMYERSYGYRYEELGDHPTAAEIAKAIRADIKQAVSEGLLPGAPVTYSVRSDTYSGGCSVDVQVRDWPGDYLTTDGTLDHWGDPRKVLTPEAEAAQMTLKRIHGAYNHDGSEIQTDYFDVRYYGQVSFESADSAQWRKAEEAKKAARKQAREAAEQAGTRRIVNYGRGGRPVIHDAVELDGRLKLVCGAQLWRGSLVGSAEGKDLTCSRCAKKAAARA